MRTNHTKQLLAAGKVALGCGMAHLRSPEIPCLYAAAGFDWVFIDTEHGCFTVETIQDLIRTSLLTSITPLVRVADLEYSLVARTLDMGAEGIIFPRVESPELLEKAVGWTKFPPQGVRGFGLTAPQMGYRAASFDEATAHSNEQTLVVLQVETTAALERREELASVAGVDVMLVGPSDLSISLGVGGQFDHPKLADAIGKVIETCGRHKIWPGIQVRSAAMAKTWIDRGAQLVGCSGDIALLWNTVKALGAELRAAVDG